MKQSKITLALSLAALLSGGLMFSAAASAHEHHSSYQGERHQQQHSERRDRHDHRQRHTNDNWYLQRHREARYYDERPMKRRHKHGHKHGQKHAYKVRRHHRSEVQHVYQPAPVQHEYRRISPLRLEIGYEIVL